LVLPALASRAWGAEPGIEPTTKTIVLFGGVKTHGPGAHEHLKGAQLLKKCLESAADIPPLKTQIYLDAWPKDPSELDHAATIVVMWEGWDAHLVNRRHPERVQKLDQLMKQGVGLVCFHAATAVEDNVEERFLDWLGGNKKIGYSLHPMARDVSLALASPGDPICRGVQAMRFPEEEFYCRIFFRPGDNRITPLLTAMLPPERPERQIVAWACERSDGGRAFACTGPHYHASFQNDDFRRLALNAILWTAKIEVPQRGVRSTVSAATGSLFLAEPSLAEEPSFAKGGRAEAVIVVGHAAGDFHRWVAGEVQRYLKQLSGAELAIVANDKVPAGKPLIVVGGPQDNPLAASAQQRKLVDFSGLKPDGFVLKTVAMEGRPAILVGGNDESGTMYAAYEFLERLGIVFQLTNDLIPEKKSDLPLPVLDVRMEPVFKHRGMHCCHGIRWYMGLEDFRREIDQLAKLKMNCLQFYWGMGGPWAEFSYGGKVTEIIYPKESGYCAWAWNSGTAKSVKVGRECFPQDYLGPPEFAKVQTPQQAFSTARDFLREVLRYAHQRKVQVWLAMGEMTYVPPNLVPPTTPKSLGFGPFYCGIAIPHGEPAMLDIWEAAVRSMIEAYPEADRYWVCTGSEAHIAASDPRTQAMIRDYAGVRRLLPQKSPAAMDTDLADVCAADKLVRRIKARYPTAKLGAELIFRGGQLRALDSVLPKDVWLMNMVNWDGETAMADFDGIRGRELVVWPRITDDGGELNIQLNAMMYDHDETIAGSVRYGLTGVLGQLNKARGAEQSAQYIAEGAWNPRIRCQPFYERYVRRLFGADAQGMLLKAFLLLEENEKALGWHGRQGIFGTYHHGNRMDVGLRQVNCKEDKPKLDRREVEKAVRAAAEEGKFWDGRADRCRQAMELLRQARPKVLPGSREELDYVIYKTENFVTVLEELSAADRAKAAFDRALLAMNAGETAEERKQLDQTQAALDRANRLVRGAAQQMIPYAHIPTERHLLYLFNDAIPSHERAERYLAEVIALRKAKTPGEKP
jgi:type 1 glutamine amidotransferase